MVVRWLLAFCAVLLLGSDCGGGSPLWSKADTTGLHTGAPGTFAYNLPDLHTQVSLYWLLHPDYAGGYFYSFTEFSGGRGKIAAPTCPDAPGVEGVCLDGVCMSGPNAGRACMEDQAGVEFVDDYRQSKPTTPYHWDGPQLVRLKVSGQFSAGQVLTFHPPPIHCPEAPCDPKPRLLPYWLESCHGLEPDGSGSCDTTRKHEARWFLETPKADATWGHLCATSAVTEQYDPTTETWCALAMPGTRVFGNYPNTAYARGFEFVPEGNTDPTLRLREWEAPGEGTITCTSSGCHANPDVHVRGCFDPSLQHPACAY